MGPVIFGLVVLVIIFGTKALRIIRPFEKGLVERLGKFVRTEDSGLAFIFPVIETIRKVDVRERVIDVPPQEVITKDNVLVTVDAVIYFQITDPFKVTYNVEHFEIAALKLAQTNLRNVIGDMLLDQTLTSRNRINEQLRSVLDEATDKWGVKVTRVELQKIDPPQDITEAMGRQMKAERTKRAVILDAEGVKQAAVLRADGEKQAEVLRAEGNRQAKILVAQGEAQAIENVYGAIHKGRPTNDLVAIKYLEALQKIADGRATKIFMPLETTGVMGSIAGIGELFKKTKETPEEEKKR